jgi:hypothetical protein
MTATTTLTKILSLVVVIGMVLTILPMSWVQLLGATSGPKIGGGCPTWACGTSGNHNETLVRDTPRPNDPAVGGGCPAWMCGTSGNHNETLLRDDDRKRLLCESGSYWLH